jgi:SSS family solute:Na+ symporter
MSLSLPDAIILIVYFLSMAAIVWHVGRKYRSTDAYFLGDSSFPGWVIALTLLATIISSQTFIAGPADAFKTSYLRSAGQLLMPVGAILAAIFLVPFFRSGFESAYEYLAARFNRSVCTFTATVFLFTMVVNLSMVSYLISILLVSITGLPLHVCLIIVAGTVGAYTSFGGFKGVVWTDVAQTLILILGGVATLVVVSLRLPGGLLTVFREAWPVNKLSFSWDINPGIHHLEPITWAPILTDKSVTVLLFVGIFSYLLGALNQVNVQRWCAASSLREARKSLILFAFLCMPLWFFFKFLGTAMWVFFEKFPEQVPMEIMSGERVAEEIFPYFILHHLPTGISGLVIAGALAAAMSTLSTFVNTGSMVWVRDFHSRFIAPGRDDQYNLKVGKAASWTLSGIMILGAMFTHRVNTTAVADISVSITAVVTSTVGGIFLVGLLSRRVVSADLWIAIGITLCFVGATAVERFGSLPFGLSTKVHIYYVGILGNFMVLVIACAIARFRKRPILELKGLTLFNYEKEKTNS